MRTTWAILAALVAAGCSTQRSPPGELRAVTPSELVPSWAGVLAIEGEGLTPRLHADFDRPGASEASYGYRARLEGEGSAIELSHVTWSSESSLSATLAPGTAPGTYALVATDPFDRELRLEAAVTVRPECASDADCATAPLCQLGPGRCEQGACRFELAADGASCDDGDLCTEQERCDGAGHCLGTAVSCAAPSTNGCTEAVAACVPDQGCTVRALPAGTVCGGTDACGATPGTCDGQGGCVGAVTSCAPPDPACQRPGSCETSGTCSYPAVVCDSPPNTQCYQPVGTCVTGSGCSYTLKSGTCDDGDPCTVGDTCGGDGSCRGTYDPSKCGAMNLPPIACVTVSPTAVVAGDSVTVTLSCSSDREDPLANLKGRIDFDGNGSWDANVTDLSTASPFRFPSAGVYVVKVEVEDSAGLVAWAEKRVAVAASASDLLVVTTEVMDEDNGTTDPSQGTGTSLTEAVKKISSDKVAGRVIAFKRDDMKLGGAAGIPNLDVPRTVLIGRPGVALQFSKEGSSGTPCMQLAGDGVQLIGLELSGCVSHPIQAKSDGVVIAESFLHRGANSGLSIKLSAPNGLTFGPGNLVTEWSGSEPAVTFKGSGSGVRIVGNEFRGNKNAIETYLPGGVIEGNVIAGNSGVGVVVGNGSNNTLVRFNTFHGNGGNAVELVVTNGVAVRDNLFTGNTGWAISGAALGAAGEPNGFWQNGAGNLSSGAPGATSVIADPRYVSAAAQDFRLRPGSPMINTGAAISGTDLNGSKPGSYDGSAPDLGARESPF